MPSAPDSESYDAIIIGSGQGGKPLALAWAQAGRKTAVIERGPAGGTCVNDGCTPTKTMIASATVAWLCGRAGTYGVRTSPPQIDMAAVRERKRAMVDRFRGGVEQSLEQADNLDLIRGDARFIDGRAIEVATPGGDKTRISAPQIFIDTGLRPVMPPIDGLDAVPTLDNVSIMELDEVPEHLLVLGGGYVGVEFAQMFRRFGSEVTIVDGSEHILKHEDDDVAEAVTQVFRDEGIQVLAKTRVRGARQENGAIRLEVDGPDGQQDVRGSHLLVAAGRAPNTTSLDLDAAGVATDQNGFVQVDEQLATTAPGIYAIGDVKGGPAFTHVSYHDFVVLKTNLLDGGRASIAERPLLYTVFTDPQLGRVGLSEAQAREQGRHIRVAKLPMSHVARAMEADDTRGMMKAVIDAETDRVLGCAIFGMEGGEIMSMLQIAMMGDLRYQQLRDGMFAHPLLAESFNSLFSGLED